MLALILASAVPLLWPDIPPMVDLPGHMARYRVQLEIGQSPTLQGFYDFQWSLIGNLGVDLLVIPLSKLVGLEAAVKLIVLSIPPLTAAGFLAVAREVHGRLPPTAMFALPLAYNFPFFFGFVNFALSMAFAFLAFALWLRLARLGRMRLRAILFVPLSVIIWITHTFGWGTLGAMAFSAELVRQVDQRRTIFKGGLHAALQSSTMALPLLLMLAWRTGDHVRGNTMDWFEWERKFDWLTMALRDRWEIFDLASLGLIGLLFLVALFHRRMEYSRNLAASAIFLALVFVLLPRVVFGSAYADMRLAPFLFALAVIAIRLRPQASGRLARGLALAGLAFFLVRTAATTVSTALYDRDYDRELKALDHVPQGARLLTFIGTVCKSPWAITRLEHISGLATERRRAFSNDQWSMPGAQLLIVRYPAPPRFVADASQLVVTAHCWREPWMTVDYALTNFPRDAFDYLWLVRPPPHDPRLVSDLTPLWRSGSSVLYAVRREPPSAAARGKKSE
jgi:hypothetical protein